MKIDERIEPLVRAVLDAAVQRDAARFDEAITRLSGPVELQEGVQLAVTICAFVVFDVHSGAPTSVQIQEIAGDIERQESWIGPSSAEVASFLDALVQRRSIADVLSQEAVIVLPFVIAANLLTTASQQEQGEWWFNYLDKVEAAIEAAG
ncbi:hypothetical protein ACIG87_08225 [Micromonospora sp. NPDC051925]|uniref:hypothetical protein n=1 Tax=Micromonospora sp. NPDC051925 TaxID=3364288 RepID=UPI0037C85273